MFLTLKMSSHHSQQLLAWPPPHARGLSPPPRSQTWSGTRPPEPPPPPMRPPRPRRAAPSTPSGFPTRCSRRRTSSAALPTSRRSRTRSCTPLTRSTRRPRSLRPRPTFLCWRRRPSRRWPPLPPQPPPPPQPRLPRPSLREASRTGRAANRGRCRCPPRRRRLHWRRTPPRTSFRARWRTRSPPIMSGRRPTPRGRGGRAPRKAVVAGRSSGRWRAAARGSTTPSRSRRSPTSWRRTAIGWGATGRWGRRTSWSRWGATLLRGISIGT